MMPSPSELERVAMCMPSEVLPRSRKDAGAAARKGTIIHRFLQRCLDAGRDVALAEADEEDIACLECIEVSSLPASRPESFNAEVSFGYNPSTEECRVLGMGLERDEARALATPDEMVGTVDVVGIENGERALVWDYKSGRGHVTRASQNWQTWTYQLMVARAFGLRRAKGGIIRANETGTWYDVCEMDELDLAQHAARLRELLDTRANVIAAKMKGEAWVADIEPHQGPWCRYCPAAATCPPRVRALVALGSASSVSDTLRALSVELTPETAAKAWHRLKNARAMLDLVDAAIREFARDTPVDLGDGVVLGERRKTSESIVADRARKVLGDTLGAELGTIVFGSAVKQEVSLTKDALRKALARYVVPTKPGSKITWEMNAALKALREKGAVAVRESVAVDEHRARDEEPAPVAATG